MSADATRRNILAGGAAAGLSLLFGRAEADQLRVPRSHGPTTRKMIARATGREPGTILISNRARTLDVVLDAQKVARYRIGIGRDGFTWTGTVRIGDKSEWPSWRPPAEMRQRQPKLPAMVPPGPFNPLGARALYLFRAGKDTLYRIHGTNDAATVGGYVTSGCFRMTNADILELYRRTPVGTTVIVSN